MDDEKIIQEMMECTKYLPYFQKIRSIDPDEFHKINSQACQVLDYEIFKKGDIISVKETKATNLYMNLEGKIGVLKERSKEEINFETSVISWIQHQLISFECIETTELQYLKQIIDPDHIHYPKIDRYQSISKEGIVRYQDWYLMNRMGGLSSKDIDPLIMFLDGSQGGLIKYNISQIGEVGMVIGEIDLIRNTNRKDTVISLADRTSICSISKINFERIFRSIINKEEIQKRIFFEKHVLFDEDVFHLSSLMGSIFEKVSFSKGSIIMREKMKISEIYFLYSGEVIISKSVENIIERSKKSQIVHKLSKKRSKNKQIKILIEGKGASFGDLCIRNIDFRIPYTVTVYSKSTFYRASASKIRNLIKRNVELNKFMDYYLNCKSQHNTEILNSYFTKIKNIRKVYQNDRFNESSTQNQKIDYDFIKQSSCSDRDSSSRNITERKEKPYYLKYSKNFLKESRFNDQISENFQSMSQLNFIREDKTANKLILDNLRTRVDSTQNNISTQKQVHELLQNHSNRSSHRIGRNKIKEKMDVLEKKKAYQKFKNFKLDKVPAPGVYNRVMEKYRTKNKSKQRETKIDLNFIYSRGDVEHLRIRRQKSKLGKQNIKLSQSSQSQYLIKKFNKTELLIQRVLSNKLKQSTVSVQKKRSKSTKKNSFFLKDKFMKKLNEGGSNIILAKEYIRYSSNMGEAMLTSRMINTERSRNSQSKSYQSSVFI